MKPKHLALAALGLALVLSTTQAIRAAGADRDAQAREYFTDLIVTDQNGNNLRFFSDVLKDRVVLINVIFTNCKDACPLVTQKLKWTMDRLVPAIKDDVWFVSISTDPERDDVAALKEFARGQAVDERRWLFLTGSPRNVHTILKKLQRFTPDFNAHSTQLLAGTTRERHEWIPISPAVQPDEIAKVLRGLAEERPG